ncbi:MAG: 3-hydroxyacyl-[acyl-carrier-protein] dehydratase FabA, partial [Deltaproteobacteria bacterium]|nr:3-hydroxyacyl-[acyl-carrier-protein] dehydratase FabA [Deltaproteobacteria bacterium]
MRTPIAITGASCVLPGAHDVEAFARLVLEGRDAVTEAPEGRFGVPNTRVRGEGRDRAWSLAGGYVSGFSPDLASLGVPGVERLDPLVHWLLHCSRGALAGLGPARTGAVFGNLSFPTDGMARWSEGLARGTDPGDPRNHFMSGLPAAIVARALGLDAGAYCLDAACASSIYAIKLACDALESGRADRMLAGAVQRADSLFLHVGFCQLGAMSKTGRSRPFHRGADGLVPAEGCVVFSLRRLDDALAAREPILGVIRGVGLSNDGRGRSLLAPSSEGQQRAMRLALRDAALPADSVQLFECHATGTPTGDRAEVESLRAVYPGGAIGSLKSNLGHLITTAGAAGLLKVLVGMARGVMPPTLHVDDPLDELGPFSILGQAREWHPGPGGQRRAAVSAFGFGGNNGHLIVDQHPSDRGSAPRRARGVLAVQSLVDRRGGDEAVVTIEGLRFPPADLSASLAQQALALQAGRDAAARAGLEVPRDRLGVYVGMGCDGLVTRWGLRWRLIHGDTSAGVSVDDVAPPLRAEHVVGTMPNIVANRLSVQLDAAGPGFSVSAEELSGLRALEAAWDALDRGEIDVAVVGAVDVAEDARATAARRALGSTEESDDAVVMLVVTRAGEGRPLATLHEELEGPVVAPRPPRHGAADAMVALADAVRRGGDSVVEVEALGGESGSLGVRGLRRVEARSQPPAGPVLRVPMHPPLPALAAPPPAVPSPEPRVTVT